MAIDKVIDSAQLDGALKASADAIRAKTGGADLIQFDPATGFAAAVAAVSTGGGTLGMKTGTVTLTESYTNIDIEHGCGKLPHTVVFVLQNPEEITPTLNLLSGGIWQRDSFSTTFRSTNGYFVNGGAQQSYFVPTDEPATYGLHVDAQKITCAPAYKWYAATYQWFAIYEV